MKIKNTWKHWFQKKGSDLGTFLIPNDGGKTVMNPMVESTKIHLKQIQVDVSGQVILNP